MLLVRSNVTYRRVVMHNTQFGPRVKGRRQGNATIRNIRFEDISLAGTQTGIQVEMTYETPGSTTSNTGCTVENVSWANVSGSVESSAGSIVCLKGRPCSGLGLSDVRFVNGSGAKHSWGTWTCEEAGGIQATGVVPVPGTSCTGVSRG